MRKGAVKAYQERKVFFVRWELYFVEKGDKDEK